MVKLLGPCQSNAASGTLAGLLTFGKTRTRSIMRKKPIPKQPLSGLQVSLRAMMTWLSRQWSTFTAPQQATWNDAFPNTEISSYNAYLKYNMQRWRSLKPPSRVFPAAEISTGSIRTFDSCVGSVRHVFHSLLVIPPINDNWGTLIFHRFAALPTLDVKYLNHVVLIEDVVAHTYRETPLPPGIHHYKTVNFTHDGNIDWLSFDDPAATVT